MNQTKNEKQIEEIKEQEIVSKIKDKTHIIIINGLGGCGKSTFIQFVKEAAIFDNSLMDELCSNIMVQELSTVDFVKEVAVYCGWRGEKEQKDREFLHALKDALVDWGNVPNRKVVQQILDGTKKYVIFLKSLNGDTIDYTINFVNIRESDGIKNFEQLCKENGYKYIRKMLVTNTNKESNEVQSLVNDILYGVEYDDVIFNDGTLENLNQKAKEYLNFITSLN